VKNRLNWAAKAGILRKQNLKQAPKILPKTFADYKADARNWITLATGEHYPDILKDACELYKPVLVRFGQLLQSSESSIRLLLQIAEEPDGAMRVQLARVFRKYVSPETPVEMLKHKSKAAVICDDFGKGFRTIQKVQAAFMSRPMPDEALCAVLWEYKDRGKKGYDLTERFFALFRSTLPDLLIKGPERAGKDILLGSIFKKYPKPDRPVDFVICDSTGKEVLAIGLARYDSDRGGSQEDDRTGGYQNCADEILNHARKQKLRAKIIFINDGPGLLLGSMWNDYARLEQSHPGKILVATLRMAPERLTREWLLS
jgi:hypothetical protein